MIIYRLERKDTGAGPFNPTLENLPSSWLYSHDTPMDRTSPCHQEYLNWIEKVTPGYTSLPICMHFGFSSLQKLIDCFVGYEDFPELHVMEYCIDTSYEEDYCILPDGQVIFRLEKSRSLLEF